MSRSTSTSSTTTTTTSNGHSRTMSIKTGAKAPALNPLPASDAKLFVTNLHLLDFDLRQDWPGITAQIYSGKNADQRQRISGTEWALFRLFEIWDPNETAQKLQPFFPPLEPLQSLNLRAALFRCLNELKKNGVLGRESVLRKTMLDECKGEKFYEILALFSSAVLKKLLAARERNGRDAAVARKLAIASMLSVDQQRSLLPLAIAHKAALVNLLKRKDEKRRKYIEFEGLLDSKAEDINRRIRKCKDTPRAKKPAVLKKEADAVKKQLKDNWIGNEKWLDVMLHGDDVQPGDAFLNSRFDEVWHMVEKGRKLEDVATEAGLLENLQSRVQEQQERLQKWKTFHEELRNDDRKGEASTIPKAPNVVKDFKFDDHLQYQLPSSKQKTEHVPVQRPSMRPEYQDILSNMDAELSNVSKAKPKPSLRKRTSSTNVSRSPNRGRKNTRSESIPEVTMSPVRPTKPQPQAQLPSLEQVPILPRPLYFPAAATPTDSEATLIGHTSTLRSAIPMPDPVESPAEVQYTSRPQTKPTPPISDPIKDNFSPEPIEHTAALPDQLSPSPEPLSHYPSEPPIPTFDLPELDAEEALADQIINSIGNATPSPVKKTQPRMSMSLIERTRISMARTHSFEPVPESPDLPLASMPPPPIPSIAEEDGGDRHATLLERTRLSMVAVQSKPRMSMAAKEKRKSRTSLFPVNQFDTPRTRKSFELIEEERSGGVERTPTDVLFSDKVDYDRVFRSRPRVATSPVWSPQVDGEQIDGGDGEEFGSGSEEEGVTGIDLGDVDQDDDGDDGFTESWLDSPSRRAGPRVVI
ncbi:hypothetical protein EJ02DRAFT_511872 [Clathrospora elynae]|uniref:HAUS augmin-like complex subunit 6 N-terminal domain-containing protein n=1 Tax=Clathrospora elynae TaxID=706981 RepID=A0A6A5SYW9_9PLEO|nr:hypothetical protein EJ02DRAFT_511872 [Clathrospora elynae]